MVVVLLRKGKLRHLPKITQEMKESARRKSRTETEEHKDVTVLYAELLLLKPIGGEILRITDLETRSD